MNRVISVILLLCMFLVPSPDLQAQKRSGSYKSTYKPYKYTAPKSNYKLPKSSYKLPKSSTSRSYDVGGTKYKWGESYKSSGLPKVDRSSSARREFLKSQGLDKTPPGYDVDHIVPLSKGGADKPYNMQLLPKDVHKKKTASERKKKFD